MIAVEVRQRTLGADDSCWGTRRGEEGGGGGGDALTQNVTTLT